MEKQWSALFPDHTAIPEKFGASKPGSAPGETSLRPRGPRQTWRVVQVPPSTRRDSALPSDMFHNSRNESQIARVFRPVSESGGRACLISVEKYRRDAHQLREHAERCRQLADSAIDRTFARVLMELADEYLQRAERLEQQAAALSQAPPASPEQQPMQQQQIQPKKEDD